MNRDEFIEKQTAFQSGVCHAEPGIDLRELTRRLATTRPCLIYHEPATGRFVPEKRAAGLVRHENSDWTGDLHGPQYKLGDQIRAGRYASQLSDLYAAGLRSPFLMDMKDAVLEENVEFPCFQYVRRPGAPNSILWPLPRVHGLDAREFCKPRNPAEPSFGEKKAMLSWRGALRGFSTLTGVRTNIKSVIKAYLADKIDKELLLAHLATVPRYAFVSRHFDLPGFDVGFTLSGQVSFYDEVPEIARYRRPYAEHEEQVNCKYLMSIQGTDVGTSFGWQLGTNCILFKEDYPWEVFFEGHVRPWEDYVPVAQDFSDVEEKLAWCEKNPEACERMIEKRHRAVRFLVDPAIMRECQRRVVERYEAFYWRWSHPGIARVIGRALSNLARRRRSRSVPVEHSARSAPERTPAETPQTAKRKAGELHERLELEEFVRRVPQLPFNVVFDVGANVGQSVQMFRGLWPNANIYAFEPVTSSFERLQKNFAGDPNVHCFSLALGNERARARVEAEPRRRMNRILAPDAETSGPTEEVAIETGANFCEAHSIGFVDYLKIDVEGFDLKVCQGFEPLLRRQQIGALQIEVGLQLEDALHLPLQAFLSYLHPFGYRLYKIHNQCLQGDRPVARRGNAVFLSLAQIKSNSAAALAAHP